MNLARFFNDDLIDVDMRVSNKDEAIEHLANLFCKKYPDKNKKQILMAIREREGFGSTSFGRGFAFPHARTDAVDDLHIVLGIIKKGTDTDAPDGVPLRVICLLLTPRNISRLYLQTLSGLARFARQPEIIDKIAAANSPGELKSVIEDSGIRVQKALTVADIMSEKTPTVSPDDSLKNVANIMFKHKVDGLPVVDAGGRVVGEISEKELLEFALPDYESFIANLAHLPELEPFEDLLRQEDKARVKDVMNRDIATIFQGAQVVEAAALMLFKDADRVMVVKDDKLVSVLSRTDIVSKIIRG